MTDTPMLDAYLRGQTLREAFHDLTPQQINDMSLSEFAARTGRPTPVQAALQALSNQEAQTPPQAPEPVFTETVTSPEPQGFDPDSPEFFHAWRANRVSGGEGKGIFDSVGSQSAEYRSAARAQAGRTGWANSNVVEPPRIEGRYLRHDDRIDHRSATERLSNAANLWQG
jgi:hypothetical protein